MPSSTVIPLGEKMRSIMRLRSLTLTSLPSGGFSLLNPSFSSASSARSTSSSLRMKSTSWSVSGPPCAHTASPPASANGICASRSVAAARRIASSRPSNWSPPLGTTVEFPRFDVSIGGNDPGMPDRHDMPEHDEMPEQHETIRIAAAGDIHCDQLRRAQVEEAFAQIAEQADLVLLAGDLTTQGELEQAEVLARIVRD